MRSKRVLDKWRGKLLCDAKYITFQCTVESWQILFSIGNGPDLYHERTLRQLRKAKNYESERNCAQWRA